MIGAVATHGLVGAVVMTAGDAAGTLDTFTPFLNIGIAGVVVVMLIFRKGIVPAWVHDQALEQIEKLEAEKAELEQRVRESTQLMVTEVVPMLTRAVDAENELLGRLREEARGGDGDGDLVDGRRPERQTGAERGRGRDENRDDWRGRSPRGR